MYGVADADSVQPGLGHRVERVVDGSLVTRHVGGEGLFSTPAMIQLMEMTCHDSVAAGLPSGHTTVGYEVCVRHLTPVRVGETVAVASRLKEVSGNRLLFEVECTKDGALVGTGTHRRAIVPAQG